MSLLLRVCIKSADASTAFKALLDLGAELRALSAVGWPPLFYAVENRRAPRCEPPARISC